MASWSYSGTTLATLQLILFGVLRDRVAYRHVDHGRRPH